MKRLPLLLGMLAIGIFLAFNTLGSDKIPPSKYERILQSVRELLVQGHYNPKEINDDFSKKVFTKYLEQLDPEKSILMQEDVDALKKYETTIDDEIKGQPVQFFQVAGNLFNKRVAEGVSIYKEILSKPFDFTVNETITTDSKKLHFAANKTELHDIIRKRLKYLTLDRYAELLDIRDKNRGKAGFVVKTDAELEKEAREKVAKIMDRMYDRYKFKWDDDYKFALFVNTITNAMDPYTEFFPPLEKRYFDETLSGRFSGIGASLMYDEGNIKINTILPGSPAQKSGAIEVGDVITKVAQGKDSAVDLTGYVVEDAVKLIRGTKGSTVNLTLRKKDGTLKTVGIVRDEIVQDETFARSAVIQDGASKIGYIYLPEFYADFENPNGARSGADVEKEVTKLKTEGVDGIVIDLRNNGGGSLYDVVQMAGLFIEDGPIVQVRDRQGKPMVMRDKNSEVLYKGPLAVMVNEFSASASEIFAAAIQDYGRGIIIGSTSTYGKGTVQRSIGLDPENGFNASNSDLGSLKLTLQKFYRINGGSTQLKGVIPDVVVPDQYEYLEFREKDNEEAMKWDEISKAPYTKWNSGYDLQTVKGLSNSRIAATPAFRQIKETTEWLSKQNDKEYPLQLDKFKDQQQKVRVKVKQMDSLLKLDKELNIAYLKADTERRANDKDKTERYNQWLKSLSKDVYLDQAVKVVDDMVNQQNMVKKRDEKAAKAF